MNDEFTKILATAGQFDVHTWSDYPEVKAVTDALFERILASTAGNASADVHLGRMYLEGVGVRTSFRKARVYFIRAARSLGYWNLAVVYQTGYGVRRSKTKASRYLRLWNRHAA